MGFRVVMTLTPAGKRTPAEIRIETKKVRPKAAVTARASFSGEDWPCWRGRRGDGTWKGPPLADKWSERGLPLLWQQQIGGGYAGVVAARNRVYTMDHRPKPKSMERILCFHAATGKKLWAHSYAVNYKGLSYASGPRASPTVHGDYVYALGAVGHLHCLEAASGKVVWSKDLVWESGARMPGWGFAAAPLIFENLLIIHAGAEPNGCLMAVDLHTGKEVWRNLSDPAGYATPILIKRDGVPEIACWTPTHVRGLNPRSGKLHWSIPFEVTYGTSIATPIFQENIILVSGYYEGSRAIRLEKARDAASVLWQSRLDLRGLMSQPLYRNGYGYLLDRRNGLSCFELKTGKKLWDDGNRMTPKGRNPQATMVWAGDGDRALILNPDCDLILARLDPAGYHEQCRSNIIGPTWAHPAYMGNCVFARSDQELVCVLLPEP
jgi:outer membrane protein assembly factor BamB